MRTSPPTRLPADAYELVKNAAVASSRTVPQQIAHWVRLGHALESSNLKTRDIQRVLDGQAPYSSLGEREQAVVRTEWDERIEDALADLDFTDELAEVGDSYVIGDGHGGAITVTPGGPGEE